MKTTKTFDPDFHPALFSGGLFRQWWILAAAMILGGLTGLGASYLFPPVYQATFTVTTNVQLSDIPDLPEILVDNSLLHVGELVYDQNVLNSVVEAEKNQGISLSQSDLRRISSVERQITNTYIKVEWNDPHTANQIANTWGNIYYAALKEGARQAAIADELTKTQTILQDCLAGVEPASATQPLCGFSKSELEAQIAQAADQIATAQNLSLGLYSRLSVDGYEEAAIPTSPIRSERGWLIGAGTAIGFIFALIAIEVIFTPRMKSIAE